jgi:formimidoylglutamase
MLHPALTHHTEGRLKRGDPADPRIGDLLGSASSPSDVRSGDVVLLGVCNEVGVRANGGRPGAAQGPFAIRRALSLLTARALAGRRVLDAGDVPPGVDYDVYLDATAEVVALCVSRGAFPVVLGGGNDCSFGSWRGLAAARPEAPTGVVNVDAHLDVRPVHGPSSGNPFFRMLEAGLPGEDLAEIALVPWVNAEAHVSWARERGVALHFLVPGEDARMLEAGAAALARFESRGRRVLATFDLDAIGAAWAPGVSAVNPWGIDAATAVALTRAFGRSPAVACFELMELCPPHDRDAQTARLAAFLIAAFLGGLAERV